MHGKISLSWSAFPSPGDWTRFHPPSTRPEAPSPKISSTMYRPVNVGWSFWVMSGTLNRNMSTNQLCMCTSPILGN